METGSKRGGNKGLIIGLIAVVVVLFAVAVVMGVKLFGRGESDTGADASTKKNKREKAIEGSVNGNDGRETG